MVYKKLLDVGKKVVKKISDKKKAREDFKKADAELEEKLFNKDGSLKVDPVKMLDKQILKTKKKLKKLKNFILKKVTIQKRTLNFKGGLMKKPKLALEML
jgi:cob(I)alamin adenosyltransferase